MCDVLFRGYGGEFIPFGVKKYHAPVAVIDNKVFHARQRRVFIAAASAGADIF